MASSTSVVSLHIRHSVVCNLAEPLKLYRNMETFDKDCVNAGVLSETGHLEGLLWDAKTNIMYVLLFLFPITFFPSYLSVIHK